MLELLFELFTVVVVVLQPAGSRLPPGKPQLLRGRKLRHQPGGKPRLSVRPEKVNHRSEPLISQAELHTSTLLECGSAVQRSSTPVKNRSDVSPPSSATHRRRSPSPPLRTSRVSPCLLKGTWPSWWMKVGLRTITPVSCAVLHVG